VRPGRGDGCRGAVRERGAALPSAVTTFSRRRPRRTPDLDLAVGGSGEEQGRDGRWREGDRGDRSIVRLVDTSRQDKAGRSEACQRDESKGSRKWAARNSPRLTFSLAPELELPNAREPFLAPRIDRRHPVLSLVPLCRLRLRERNPLHPSRFDLTVRARDAVRGRDFELEELGVRGGGVELERGRVTRGEDEGRCGGIDGEGEGQVGATGGQSREAARRREVCLQFVERR
jgi:hypothetical protein